MAYEKIGTINNVSEIEFDKEVIVSGKVDRIGWMWRMGGIFRKIDNKEIVFKNEHGMSTNVVNNEVSLNILRKI